MSEKNNLLKSLMKGTGLVIAGLVALPFLAFAAFWFYADVILGPDHKPSFLAKVTVDLVVDGEPVLIERIIECKTYELPPGELLGRVSNGRKIPTKYFPTVRAFGAKLQSGGAIMMLTPYRCGHQVLQEGALFKRHRVQISAHPQGALPMMAWTADADNPEVVEVYASHAYFDHPEARVQVNDISVRAAPEGAEADPWGPYGWFVDDNTYYSGGEKVAGASSYRALSVIFIEKEEWSQYFDFETVFGEIETLTLLPREIVSELPGQFRASLSPDRDIFGANGNFSWMPPASSVSSRIKGHRIFYPVPFNDAVFSFESTLPPYLLAYNSSLLKRDDIRSNFLRIRGVTFENLNLRNRHYFYDPVQQDVIVMQLVTIYTNATKPPVPRQFNLNSRKEPQS